jgi:hypothetical protein
MKIIDINGSVRECSSVVSDKNFAGYMKVEFVSKTRKGYSHSEWIPTQEFLINNPQLKHLVGKNIAVTEASEDLGVVSTAKPLSISDKKKRWKENIYIGFPVWISRGKGEGQIRKVVSNTKNSLTIDKKWNVLPDSSSQYVLSRNVHKPKTFENTLPTES